MHIDSEINLIIGSISASKDSSYYSIIIILCSNYNQVRDGINN